MNHSSPQSVRLLRPTVDIAAAYVGNHAVQIGEVTTLLDQIFQALQAVERTAADKPARDDKPAVSIKKSIQPDFLICLNDGRRFKSLKRHLRVTYGMSPEEYRAKWGLPVDYPMVAPGYARERSRMAKEMGLGLQRRRK